MLEELEEKVDDLVLRSELQEIRLNDINSKLDLLLSKTYLGTVRNNAPPPAPGDRRSRLLKLLFSGDS